MSPARVAVRVLAVAGVLSLASGFYLPAKASLGQVLLRLAWQRTQDAAEPQRPWPWASTWPVARLRAPAYDVDQIVLEGADGESLAWAPGLVAGSARLGQRSGNVAIAGHRDTHFRFLRHLRSGDEIVLTDPGGHERRYLIEDASIVDETDIGVLASTPRATLTLVTCYPFDAIRPGGTLRYVVRAVQTSTPSA
jgi:sortase A